MAMAGIDNLNVNREAGKPTDDTGHFRRLLPFEVGSRAKPKALLATGMIVNVRRNTDRLVPLCIVVGKDPNIARQTDTGVDAARS
jgi:hypothetical protein